MLLIYWISESLKYKGNLHLGIALSKRQIVLLLLSEIALFSVLFLFFYVDQEPNVANSFAWQNMFYYFRGVLPLVALMSLDDSTFRFSDPTWECLVTALILDFIVLLITAKIKRNVSRSDAYKASDQ